MASAAQRKVRNAFKRASATCHAETSSPSAFGKCVRREMRSSGVKKATKKKKKGPSLATKCAGYRRKGGRTVLRKGYKAVGKGRCPRKVAAR